LLQKLYQGRQIKVFGAHHPQIHFHKFMRLSILSTNNSSHNWRNWVNCNSCNSIYASRWYFSLPFFVIFFLFHFSGEEDIGNSFDELYTESEFGAQKTPISQVLLKYLDFLVPHTPSSND
jgi:hypothetical protein